MVCSTGSTVSCVVVGGLQTRDWSIVEAGFGCGQGVCSIEQLGSIEQPPAAWAVSVLAGFVTSVSWARIVVESVSTTWIVRLRLSTGHQLCMDGCKDHDYCNVLFL